jgi:hypothetical protein
VAQLSFFFWHYGTQLVAELKAVEALDLLIANFDREEEIQYGFGVPGFAVTESTNPKLPFSGILYGPVRRGSDPDRAFEYSKYIGFPGNSVDTRGYH